jgi:AcrR family transcriptional regulator
MARITEPMKIEKIKRAVMEVMCESGFGQITIALISEKSGVSSGYLYRFYSGKDELLQDIVKSAVDEIKGKVMYDTKRYNTVYDCFLNIISRVFEIANADPILGRFLAKTAQETNLPSWAEEAKNKELIGVIDEMIRIGRETGEISSYSTYADIELVLLSLPFRYIELEFSKNKRKNFTKEEGLKITNMCMKALG